MLRKPAFDQLLIVNDHIMKIALNFLFCLFTLTALGQRDNYRPFRASDYPPNKYSVKSDTFIFRNFKIEVTHTKLLDYKTFDSTATYCRLWLTVKDGNTIVDKFYVSSCEAVGGCSGIYASNEQASKEYFILSKFGDYDGQIIIIDKSGKIKTFVGGHYYLSPDNKYLFSPYSSDLAGLTVYDLVNNKVLFTSDNLQTYLADFYLCNKNYFAIVSEEVKELDQTNIVTFDFKTNTLIKSKVPDSYISRAKRLKSYNVFQHTPCDCGQSKE